MPDAQELTPYNIARRFLGMAEVEGATNNPAIVAMLQLDATWAENDEVPWCSAFANACAWLAGFERSKSLRARSWLRVGERVRLDNYARTGDVVILQRGGAGQPGPDVIKAPGHVGFFVEWKRLRLEGSHAQIRVLGGNQRNEVSIASYPTDRLLGIRRLRPVAAGDDRA